MHEKLSAKNLAAVNARSAVTIRQLVDQNSDLMEKNASLEAELQNLRRETRIRELAAEMDDKGLNAQLSFDEKLAHLRQIVDLDPVDPGWPGATINQSFPGSCRRTGVCRLTTSRAISTMLRWSALGRMTS